MEQTTTDVFRPRTFAEFVGQQDLKETLTVHIQAARARDTSLQHVFLSGPPGFGKTTLATIIATALGDPLLALKMPLNEKTLYRQLLYSDFPGGVLFLDEIHACSKKQQEALLPLLDSLTYHLATRSVVFRNLTVIGATTERDKIIAPLHDRFPVAPEFEPYTDDEMRQIVEGMCRATGLTLDREITAALGRASGGVPRMSERLVLAARDLAVTGRTVDTTTILDLCGVDADGLSTAHRRYLGVLYGQNGMAGQTTLELLLRSPNGVIRNLERLLLERRLIEYTPGGRELTPAGIAKVTGHGTKQYVREGP